jgi:hypothetical protein
MRTFLLVLFTAVSLQAQGGARFTATSANVSGAGEAIKINLTDWSPDSRRDELVAAWTLTATAAPQGRGGARGAGGAAGAPGGAARGGGARGARGAGAAAPAPAAAPAAVPDLPVDPDNPDPAPAPAARGRGGARGAGGGAGGGANAPTPESSLAAALKKAPTVGILWTSENVGYSIKYAYHLPQPDGGERIVLATDRRVGAWSTLWTPAASITPTNYPFSLIELRVNSKGEGDGRGVMTGKVVVDSAAKTIALDGFATLPVVLKAVKRQAGS